MMNSNQQKKADRLERAGVNLGFAPAVPPAPRPQQAEIAQATRPAPEPTQAKTDTTEKIVSAPPSPTPPAPPPPVVRTSPEVLAQLAVDDMLLEIGRQTLELASPELLPERSSKEQRRKMPKSRTGSFHNPYPGKKRDTVRTSFSFSMEGRMELERFFVELGPQRRHLWTEQVLLRNARLSLAAMRKKAEHKTKDDGES